MQRLLALALFAAAFSASAAPEYPHHGPDIYDPQADGNAQVQAAVARAGAEHKRILLDFGANWCPWCHLLHATFAKDPTVSAELQNNFIVVMIDVNTRKGTKRNAALNERLGNPIQHGLPVLMVLDSDGTALTTKDSGELEEGNHHSPAKIEAFLEKWAPPRS